MTDAAAIAEAFSRHEFATAYPHLAPDVRWVAHGAADTVGREAVIAACEATLAQLRDATVTVRSLRTVVGADVVVVDAVVHYAQPDGTFVVASCDLYDVAADARGDVVVTGITSYVVEIPPPPT